MNLDAELSPPRPGRQTGILDIIPEGFHAIDAAGRYTNFNEAARRLLAEQGQDAAALIGKHIFNEAFPELRDLPVGRAIERTLRERVPSEAENLYQPWQRWYQVRNYPMPDGGVATFFQDITPRKQADEALRRSEARLQKAISIPTVGVLFFKLDGTILDGNEAVQRMSGYTAEELRGITDWTQLTPPEFREATQRAAAELADRGLTAPYEKQWFRKDGSRFWGLFSPTRLSGSGIESECIESIIDITERKKIEGALRDSEERQAFLLKLSDALRPLGDMAPVQIAACRVLGEHLCAGRVFYCEVDANAYVLGGQFARRLPPLPAGRYPTANYGEAVIDDYRAGRTVVLADLQSDGRLSPDVRSAWAGLQCRAAVGVPLVKNGHLVAVLGVHMAEPRDWTTAEVALIQETAERTWAAVEGVRAEQALRKSQERFELMRDGAQIGFWFCDLPFDKLIWDNRVKAHFWLPPDATVTIDTFYERIHPSDRERTRAAIATSIANHTRYDIEYRTVSPVDGREKWIRAIGRGFYAADGQPIRFDGVTLDITQNKLAEAALRQTQAELVAANQQLASRAQQLESLVQQRTAKLMETIGELEGFSYSITHDMRAPLRAINSYSLMLAEDYAAQLDEDGRRLLARMSRAVTRMDKLIQDVLQFSKVLRMDLKLEPVNTDQLVRGMLETYPDFQEPKATVVFDGQLPEVLANEAALTQCFSNVLNNAVKFVSPGTKPKVTIRAETKQSAVRFWIEDNGIGFDPKYLETMFGLFQRLTHEYEGTGVGLSIVRKAVERMGGKAGAESCPGQGSRFWFELNRPNNGSAKR